MFITIDDLLSPSDANHITDIANYEIDNFLCLLVPYYQSDANMQEKYSDDPVFQRMIYAVNNAYTSFNQNPIRLKKCWFNICKKDSVFDWHSHPHCSITAVYYLKGCQENGTEFLFNNTKIKALSKDNSLLFFDPNLNHRVPGWNGVDRYTIAFEFL